MKKRSMTLLEVIIALFLTMIILSTLLFFYEKISTLGKEIDEAEAENFKWSFLENRLLNIIPRAVSKTDKLKDFTFFTASDDRDLMKPGSLSLIFTYESNVQLDKGFGYHAIGRLFLDKNNRLIFAYWPTPKWWKNGEAPLPKKEILMEGVESLDFEFFIPPNKGKKEVAEPGETAPPEPEPKGKWRKKSWPQEYEQLPALVKVEIKLAKSENKKEFILPLLNTKKPIIYE